MADQDGINFILQAGYLLAFVVGLYFVVSFFRKAPTTNWGKHETNWGKHETELVGRVKRMRLLLAAFYLTLPLITLFTLALRFDTYEHNRIADFSSALEDFFSGYIMYLSGAWWPFLLLQRYFAKYIMLNKAMGRWVFLPIIASLICFSIPDALFLWVMAYDIMETDFSSYTSVSTTYARFFAFLGPVVGLVFAIVGWYVAKFALKLRRRSD